MDIANILTRFPIPSGSKSEFYLFLIIGSLCGVIFSRATGKKRWGLSHFMFQALLLITALIFLILVKEIVIWEFPNQRIGDEPAVVALPLFGREALVENLPGGRENPDAHTLLLRIQEVGLGGASAATKLLYFTLIATSAFLLMVIATRTAQRGVRSLRAPKP